MTRLGQVGKCPNKLLKGKVDLLGQWMDTVCPSEYSKEVR